MSEADLLKWEAQAQMTGLEPMLRLIAEVRRLRADLDEYEHPYSESNLSFAAAGWILAGRTARATERHRADQAEARVAELEALIAGNEFTEFISDDMYESGGEWDDDEEYDEDGNGPFPRCNESCPECGLLADVEERLGKTDEKLIEHRTTCPWGQAAANHRARQVPHV